MGKNPLHAILAETINFERLARAPTNLFITATNVGIGRGHVFKNQAVTVSMTSHLNGHLDRKNIPIWNFLKPSRFSS